jgi:hypothetical protein
MKPKDKVEVISTGEKGSVLATHTYESDDKSGGYQIVSVRLEKESRWINREDLKILMQE